MKAAFWFRGGLPTIPPRLSDTRRKPGGNTAAAYFTAPTPSMASRSFCAVVTGMMLNFSTSTFSTAGVTKAGSVGPRRMVLMPRNSSVSRMQTAYFSYQLSTIDCGSSFTPTPKALESATATCMAE